MTEEWTPKIVNSMGLILDIAGAVLLWKYGLPESVSRTGRRYLTIRPEDPTEMEKEIAKVKKYDTWSQFGLFLLVLGFIGQLISNFL